MKPLPHGTPDVSMTMGQSNNVPFSRSLFARARYSSSRASRADFEEAGAVSSERCRAVSWAVESASIPGSAMKSSSRAAVMRPRIAGNLRHTSRFCVVVRLQGDCCVTARRSCLSRMWMCAQSCLHILPSLRTQSHKCAVVIRIIARVCAAPASNEAVRINLYRTIFVWTNAPAHTSDKSAHNHPTHTPKTCPDLVPKGPGK